jgi:nicotinamidase-related amidase
MRNALIVVAFQDGHDDKTPRTAGWLANTLRAMDAAARADVPIALIRQVAEVGSPFARHRRDPRWGIHADIATRGWEVLIDTCGHDMFSHPGFVAWLRKSHIDTVTLCGYLPQGCIEASVERARRFGGVVEMLADAIEQSSLGLDAPAGEDAAPATRTAHGDISMTTREWVNRLGVWKKRRRLQTGFVAAREPAMPVLAPLAALSRS